MSRKKKKKKMTNNQYEIEKKKREKGTPTRTVSKKTAAMIAITLALPALLILSDLSAQDQIVLSDGTFQKNLQPTGVRKLHPDEIQTFSTEDEAWFRLLHSDGNSLLIGASNVMHNISLDDFRENVDHRLRWDSSVHDLGACFRKGKSLQECQNYIRVFTDEGDGERLVCGTHAFQPRCRHYHRRGNFSEGNGAGICPFDPRHTPIYVRVRHQLYSATATCFHRGDCSSVRRSPLTTVDGDSSQLNFPVFVHSFEYGDFVFFFFRERAVEFMNCGKRIVSRVARVCKNDRGGPKKRVWTSFLKTRLNCSIPGEYPFYFDEIQSVDNANDSDLIFAVFNTPPNSIRGSAVCAFSKRAILAAFEGSFKEQKTIESTWEPVVSPHPGGGCVNDSSTLSETKLNFIRTHPLMNEAVPAFFGRPILSLASFAYQFTAVAVDPQVSLLGGATVDVLFVALSNGSVLKVVSGHVSGNLKMKIEPVVIEVILVGEPRFVRDMRVAERVGNDSRLIVVTDEVVMSVSLHRCHRATTCPTCVGLRDPYCVWFNGDGKCAPLNRRKHGRGPMYQTQCPEEHAFSSGTTAAPLFRDNSTFFSHHPQPQPQPQPQKNHADEKKFFFSELIGFCFLHYAYSIIILFVNQ